MILNCLLLYAISINAKSGLQKIIKSDQSRLGAVLNVGQSDPTFFEISKLSI